MLAVEHRCLQRYAIETIPARVYEGCCTWFTILVLSAQRNQKGRRRTARCGVFARKWVSESLLSSTHFLAKSEARDGPRLPAQIAHGHSEMCEGVPRLSKSRPLSPSPATKSKKVPLLSFRCKLLRNYPQNPSTKGKPAPTLSSRRLPILLKAVALPQPRLDLRVLVGEILLPPRAEIDVPPPEPPDQRLGVPVIMRPQLAGLARVGFCFGHGCYQGSLLIIYNQGNSDQSSQPN